MEFLYSVAPDLAILRLSSFSHLLLFQMTNLFTKEKTTTTVPLVTYQNKCLFERLAYGKAI